MYFASKCFIFCLLSLTLGATATENSNVTDANLTCLSESSITISEGDTIQLIFDKSLMESDVNFRGYRLSRDGKSFAYQTKGSQCLTWISNLEPNLNVLSKKVMFDCNITHLRVQMENASLQDSGNYSITHIFDSVHVACNFLDTKKVTVKETQKVSSAVAEQATSTTNFFKTSVVPSSVVLSTVSTSAQRTAMLPISVNTPSPGGQGMSDSPPIRGETGGQGNETTDELVTVTTTSGTGKKNEVVMITASTGVAVALVLIASGLACWCWRPRCEHSRQSGGMLTTHTKGLQTSEV